jgi:cysteinyl-tRNA synthetase
VHNKFVTVDGKKMGKSLGNAYTPVDLIQKGYDPLAYRLMMFEHHYGQQLDFTWDKLDQSNARLLGLRKDIAQIRSLVESSGAYSDSRDIAPAQKQLYTDVLVDNLNTPLFLEKFQKLVNEILDRVIKEKDFNNHNINLLRYLEEQIIDCDLWPEIPAEVTELAKARVQAKADKDYAQADTVRAEIQAKGFDVGDFPWGFGIWKVK